MNKWEEKYNEFKAGKLDEELKALQELVDSKSATKEQYEEYKKYSVIKDNMRRIENILEYRDFQKKKIDKIDEILEKRNFANNERNRLESNLDKAQENITGLEVEMISLNEERENLIKKLKSKNLSDESKSEINEKILGIQNKINENNKKYVAKSQELKTTEEKLNDFKSEDETFAKYEESDIKSVKMQLSQRISKCNMVARNLFEGRSWDYIDLKLDNWKDRKFTSKTELSKIVKPISGKEQINKIEKEENNNYKSEKEDLGLQKVDDWNIKHPKLAKIKNWFKSIFKNNKKEKDNQEKDNQEKNSEEKDIESNVLDDIDFKTFIKELAEKGMQQMENEKEQKTKEEAKKKFENAKKEAHKRETEKYGKDYADKSVKVEEEMMNGSNREQDELDER